MVDPSRISMSAATVVHNTQRTCERLTAAAAAAGRDPRSVRLLLATKTQTAEAVRTAVEAARACGIEPLVGENRVQELVAKAAAFADLGVSVHLIGSLQSNKVTHALRALRTPGITGLCVETVDSIVTAQQLVRRWECETPLPIMIQVNVSGESTKSGVPPEDALKLATEIGKMPSLHLTGLMTIGARSPLDDTVSAGFRRLQTLRDELRDSGQPGTAGIKHLSMGMSRDLELAVAAGASVVRVGTAAFGERP